ncbi:MAG TPA: citrate/2-methylcitrate synthase, partial [Steroidobacteraceae bacterium]|nr:citrate/2-methylcitrate synthase [Steroidobacteraceae bacterium]
MNGLDDVIAADTILSDVDGQAGTLIIRGRSLDELAERSSYETVLALLWDGLFDEAPAASTVPTLLGRARSVAFEQLGHADLPRLQRDPVEALRMLLAQIDDGEGLGTAVSLVGAAAVFTAAVLRLRQGLKPIEPDASEPHSADLLRMIHGTPPTAEQVIALDRYLVTVSDHGLNASTFAARVVAS